MKSLILLLLITSSLLASWCPWEFNYRNGRELAIFQDSLITKYKRGEWAAMALSDAALRTMKRNLWVAQSASKKNGYYLNPSNLVLRQWALIDIYSIKPIHAKRIEEMMDFISGGPKEHFRTWAEGYHYWLYTNVVLEVWLNKFLFEHNNKSKEIQHIYEMQMQIIQGFAATAYLGLNGKWYPAPFGDLSHIPLDEEGQFQAEILNDLISKKLTVQNITRIVHTAQLEYISYQIQAFPIGLNTHAQAEDSEIEIFSGMVSNFNWYLGYDKKYKDKKAEILDYLHWRRLLVTPFIW